MLIVLEGLDQKGKKGTGFIEVPNFYFYFLIDK